MKRLPPLVSILVPVYNGASYVRAAIDSLLAQEYQHWECIIINDGSTDNSGDIVKSYTDPRIRYYEQSNHGLGATLNRAISLARGTYLARQDQDDISLPQRLRKQVTFLTNSPQTAIVGTWAQIWHEQKKTDQLHEHPTDSTALKFFLLFDNPFVHSSVMMRKDVLDVVGGYTTDGDRQPPEDYDLWSRIARSYPVANIPEVLHIYRETSTSMSRTGVHPFLKQLITISTDNLCLLFGSHRSRADLQRYAALYHGAYAYVETGLKKEIAPAQMLSEAVQLLRGDIQTNQQLRDTVRSFGNIIQKNYRRYRYGTVAAMLLNTVLPER